MNFWEVITTSIIEGITEFLPISSTGHMIVASDLLGFSEGAALQSFEIMVQLAAILAAAFYFRHRIRLTKRLLLLLMIGSFPILSIGFLFADQVREMLEITVVAWMFIIGGIVFLITEYCVGSRLPADEDVDLNQSLEALPMRKVAMVGLAQSLSLIPGTSRAGATIVGGLWLGISRRVITEFSFLIAIPVIAAVALYEGVDQASVLATAPLGLFFAGFVVAFIVAYFTIVFFVRYVGSKSFVGFGIYRIIFGLILLIFFV